MPDLLRITVFWPLWWLTACSLAYLGVLIWRRFPWPPPVPLFYGPAVIVLLWLIWRLVGSDDIATPVEAAGTVAVALFAVMQMERDKTRQAHEERLRLQNAHERVGYLAYKLSRQLGSWHGVGGTGFNGIGSWFAGAQTAGGSHLKDAQGCVDGISAAVPDLSQDQQAAAHNVIRRFLEASDLLNQFVAATAAGIAVVSGNEIDVQFKALNERLNQSLVLKQLKAE